MVTCNFIKSKTSIQAFFVTFTKFLRTLFLMNTSGLLLLVFQQLTLSNFKMCCSTAIIAFNNYTIVMTNNSGNIRISECSVVVFQSHHHQQNALDIGLLNTYIFGVSTKFQSHHHLQDALKVSLLKLIKIMHLLPTSVQKKRCS